MKNVPPLPAKGPPTVKHHALANLSQSTKLGACKLKEALKHIQPSGALPWGIACIGYLKGSDWPADTVWPKC